MLFGKKYKVDYNGQKDWFRGAKDSYRAGERVRLIYDMIATDTNYTFTVDGAYFSPKYVDNSFVIEFDMPAHDVSIRVTWVNSMTYVPPQG